LALKTPVVHRIPPVYTLPSTRRISEQLRDNRSRGMGMNSPIVVICCHDHEWMTRARSALEERGYEIRERLGELTQIDLMADGDQPAPDIVLWRFDGVPAAHVQHQLTNYSMRWALGTKFVFVRYRRWGIPLIYMILRSPSTIPYWLRF